MSVWTVTYDNGSTATFHADNGPVAMSLAACLCNRVPVSAICEQECGR